MTLWAIAQRNARGWSVNPYAIRFSRRSAYDAWDSQMLGGIERRARVKAGILRAVKIRVEISHD